MGPGAWHPAPAPAESEAGIRTGVVGAWVLPVYVTSRGSQCLAAAKLGCSKSSGPCCAAPPVRVGMRDESYFGLVSLPLPPSPISL